MPKMFAINWTEVHFINQRIERKKNKFHFLDLHKKEREEIIHFFNRVWRKGRETFIC